MDDILTQPKPQPAMNYDVVQQAPMQKKRKIWPWIVLVVVIILIAGVALLWHHKKAVVLTPEETLQNLKGSSEPVTTTPQQQAADLSKAEKSSVQYQVTTQQRLDTLNALSK